MLVKKRAATNCQSVCCDAFTKYFHIVAQVTELNVLLPLPKSIFFTRKYTADWNVMSLSNTWEYILNVNKYSCKTTSMEIRIVRTIDEKFVRGHPGYSCILYGYGSGHTILGCECQISTSIQSQSKCLDICKRVVIS